MRVSFRFYLLAICFVLLSLGVVRGQHSTVNRASHPRVGGQQEIRLIDEMWNALTCYDKSTNQIDVDPSTGMVIVAYRCDTYRTYGDEIMIRRSVDGGKTWEIVDSCVNRKFLNNAGKLSGRHPNIHFNRTPDNVQYSVLWSQLRHVFSTNSEVFGEVGYAKDDLGVANPLRGRIAGPMYFGAPTRIVEGANGALFSLAHAMDSTGNSLGAYYLLQSSDGGAVWEARTEKPLFSNLNDSIRVLYPKIDASPDGSTLVVGYVATKYQGEVVDHARTVFGYVLSTDYGATWSDPVVTAPRDWQLEGVTFSGTDCILYPVIDAAVDGNNEPHFLAVLRVPTERFFPVDSCFIGEMILRNNALVFRPIGSVLYPEYRIMAWDGGPDDGYYRHWNDPAIIKDTAGNILNAVWMGVFAERSVSTGELPSPPPNYLDVINDIRGASRTITDSSDLLRNWSKAKNLLTGIDQLEGVRMLKNARTMDVQGALHFLVTAPSFYAGPGAPIADDYSGTAELYYVRCAAPALAVENAASSAQWHLSQNYPNPFNPSTTIEYSVPKAGKAMLRVYTLLGREVVTIVDGYIEAGNHTVVWNATGVPSGNYIYRLESGNGITTRIMTLVK